MTHGLDTSFLVAAEVAEHAEHAPHFLALAIAGLEMVVPGSPLTS